MDIFDEKGLEKFPDNITKFVGADFKDTYRKVVEWLEKRKLLYSKRGSLVATLLFNYA